MKLLLHDLNKIAACIIEGSYEYRYRVINAHIYAKALTPAVLLLQVYFLLDSYTIVCYYIAVVSNT